eukprot:357565-Chlamydomonas_euryale.AAC.8
MEPPRGGAAGGGRPVPSLAFPSHRFSSLRSCGSRRSHLPPVHTHTRSRPMPRPGPPMYRDGRPLSALSSASPPRQRTMISGSSIGSTVLGMGREMNLTAEAWPDLRSMHSQVCPEPPSPNRVFTCVHTPHRMRTGPLSMSGPAAPPVFHRMFALPPGALLPWCSLALVPWALGRWGPGAGNSAHANAA